MSAPIQLDQIRLCSWRRKVAREESQPRETATIPQQIRWRGKKYTNFWSLIIISFLLRWYGIWICLLNVHGIVLLSLCHSVDVWMALTGPLWPLTHVSRSSRDSILWAPSSMLGVCVVCVQWRLAFTIRWLVEQLLNLYIFFLSCLYIHRFSCDAVEQISLLCILYVQTWNSGEWWCAHCSYINHTMLD